MQGHNLLSPLINSALITLNYSVQSTFHCENAAGEFRSSGTTAMLEELRIPEYGRHILSLPTCTVILD